MAVLRAVPLADRRARGARAGPERRGPHAPEHARIHRVWPHGRGSARARDQRGWEGREDGSGVERTDMERGAVLLTLSTGGGRLRWRGYDVCYMPGMVGQASK